MIVIYPNVFQMLRIIGIIYAVMFCIVGIYQWMEVYSTPGMVKFRRSILWLFYFVALFIDFKIER